MTFDQFRGKYGTKMPELIVRRAIECAKEPEDKGASHERIFMALDEMLYDLQSALEHGIYGGEDE